MSAVFADTFYFLALVNERDAAHGKAVQFDAATQLLVTTAWVLTEVGDALSAPENRPLFCNCWTRCATRRMRASSNRRPNCSSTASSCFASVRTRIGC